MFWVLSVYFNIRNTLPKSGTFLLGHPVYIYIYIYINYIVEAMFSNNIQITSEVCKNVPVNDMKGYVRVAMK